MLEIKLDLKEELKNFLNKQDQYTIPIFIPHNGCPQQCVFCNQRKISGIQKESSFKEVEKTIASYLSSISKSENKKKIEIAFFGGSFTGIDINLQIQYLELANKYIDKGCVDSIRISTRPDYISPKILRILKKYNVKTIELGVQTTNDELLVTTKRGHTRKDIVYSSLLIRQFGFILGHQIMVGLPKSTDELELETIKTCLKLKPSQLRIYPVYVIEGSELYDMYKNGDYIPLNLNEAVRKCKVIVKECTSTEVSIIRLGLQSSDEITSANTNMYGPISDNFAEYVMADIVKDKIENEIKGIENIETLVIHIPSKYMSICIGPKKINKEYFESKYNLKYIVKGDV